MAISEKSRSALYQGLAPIAGEEAVGEMLSFFPARDVDEPVTKEFLRAEIADLRAEMHRGFASQTRWMVGTLIAMTGIFAAIVNWLH
jgi:hypothetical protein